MEGNVKGYQTWEDAREGKLEHVRQGRTGGKGNRVGGKSTGEITMQSNPKQAMVKNKEPSKAAQQR